MIPRGNLPTGKRTACREIAKGEPEVAKLENMIEYDINIACVNQVMSLIIQIRNGLKERSYVI